MHYPKLAHILVTFTSRQVIANYHDVMSSKSNFPFAGSVFVRSSHQDVEAPEG